MVQRVSELNALLLEVFNALGTSSSTEMVTRLDQRMRNSTPEEFDEIASNIGIWEAKTEMIIRGLTNQLRDEINQGEIKRLRQKIMTISARRKELMDGLGIDITGAPPLE